MLIAFCCRHCRHLTVIIQERFARLPQRKPADRAERSQCDNESGTAGTAIINLLPSLKGNPPLRDGFIFTKTSFQRHTALKEAFLL